MGSNERLEEPIGEQNSYYQIEIERNFHNHADSLKNIVDSVSERVASNLVRNISDNRLTEKKNSSSDPSRGSGVSPRPLPQAMRDKIKPQIRSYQTRQGKSC